ncbi:MAG: glutamate--tRNA ligase [Candidatus Marinimicrobia bacterium]|nr:glutamate--tRNA ligase [Candidatus Neomarinimicrobiota bacterium]
MSVRVRFAPSPTGFLHVGGLRTALYNWLFARGQSGTFILRIEDTDPSRQVEGAVDNLLASLAWAGLDIDEGPGMGGEHGPYLQSQRLDIYHNHVRQLLAGGHAYPCFCTPERLTEVRERQRSLGLASRYDRHCRNLPPGEAASRAENEPHVVRLAVPETGRIVMEDIVRQKVGFDLESVDDQVLLKTDGFPTYHLANVVDDHLMAVSHVIRGEEWLPSMPKHLLLYRFFQWEPPQFAHLPLLLNPDRSKLSKRQGTVAVENYRQEGYLAQTLVNFVALLGWHDASNQELFSLDELVQAFSLERIQKGGAIFDREKLLWLNGQHIRRLSLDQFRNAIEALLDPDWQLTDTLAAAIHTKVNLLTEAPDQLAFFFEEPLVLDEAAQESLASAEARGVLLALQSRLEEVSEFSGEWFLSAVKGIGAEFAIKGRDLWQPIRAAIAGRVAGPDMVTIVEHFGLDKLRQRIQAALSAK